MPQNIHSSNLILLFALGWSVGLVEVAEAGREEIIASGKQEYVEACKACHGKSGKGDGEMARLLIKRPADLTKIGSQNDGAFPFWRVFEVISGIKKVNGHQSFQMPDYWNRFRRDEGTPGYDTADQRILAITHYLESIQDAE